MAINSISNAAANLQGAGLGLQDLLKILLTQLTYQDPLKPMDNQEFVAQIAQFSALESGRQVNERVDQLLSIQSTSQTIGLLGKTIEAQTASGKVVGTVSSLTLVDGKPTMTLNANGQLFTGITFADLLSVR
ncbi:flagellar basal-body rod modification protein FlgD [Chitinivorax tropicus]|uniref:Basal-body rod modification protein FlgD n=1 Tax=Chitinivorax tropicus TaxID=714531 RepID=A0A840MYR7_9PROT|nr:flagellar hook capping FlgD N-terminal domain-containing protein [Chitinivorax tropicus]MBB5020301.1 flagellar basal-body rod modification protein FlgD [Chitinivorax tropicus]